MDVEKQVGSAIESVFADGGGCAVGVVLHDWGLGVSGGECQSRGGPSLARSDR